MKSVFLSASIPDPGRNPVYFRTGDVINIREAVRALVAEVLPRGRLVFGGHPAISPFVRAIARSLAAEDRVSIYQSRFFESVIPEAHRGMPGLIWVDEAPQGRAASLRLMREAMLDCHDLVAGVFIGGMEGVEEEFDLFRGRLPGRPAIPVPTTGAAARRLFAQAQLSAEAMDQLSWDVAYDLLFETLLRPLLALQGTARG